MRIKNQIQKPLKPRLKKRVSRVFIRFMLPLLVVLGLFFFFSGKLQFLLESLQQTYSVFQKTHGFRLEEILLEGRSQTQKEDLLAQIGVKAGMPILSIPLTRVQQRVLDLPWVKTAQVERHLPDLLIIRIKEHKPLALWQQGKTLSLISEDETEVLDPHPERFTHLPKVMGAGALKKTKAFLQALKTFPQVWNQMLYAHYVSKRRWSVVLKNQTRIDFPELNLNKSIEKLKTYHKKHRALERFKVIDLRLTDKVIVKK